MSTHSFMVSIDAGANWGIVDATVTYSAFEGGNWHRMAITSVMIDIAQIPTDYLCMLTDEQHHSLALDAWSDFRERSAPNRSRPACVKPQPEVGKNTGSSASERPQGDNPHGRCGLTPPTQVEGAAPLFNRLVAGFKIFLLRVEYGVLMVDAYLADQRDDRMAAEFWRNLARKRESEISLISLNQRFVS